MTDISPEKVMESAANLRRHAANGYCHRPDMIAGADILEALAAERDALRVEVERLKTAGAAAGVVLSIKGPMRETAIEAGQQWGLSAFQVSGIVGAYLQALAGGTDAE